MAINFVNSIDLNKNELQNAVIQNVTATPEGGTYSAGQAVYDTNATKLKIYNGSTWEQVGGSFTLRADGPAGANSYVVEPGAVVDLLGGTNMSVARGAGAASNQFTINTTATPDQDVALTGDVTGTLVLSSGEIATTLSAGVVTTAKFAATSLTISTEDFVTNAVDTQVPTTLSVKNYVDEIVTGDLVFLGGLDASTGEITSGEFASSQLYNGDTSARAVAADRYFVVTEPGDFFGNGDFPLTLGDRVVAAVAIPTNTVFDSTKIASDWTIIQSSNELATLTTVGIGNVGAGTATSGIDVTYSQGTASLVLDANELGAGSGVPVTLVGTNSSGATKKFTESDVHSGRGKYLELNAATETGVARAVSGGITTYTITLATAWVNVSGIKVSVEVVEIAGSETVYAQVNRTATTITVKFTGTVADDTYYVLLKYVG